MRSLTQTLWSERSQRRQEQRRVTRLLVAKMAYGLLLLAAAPLAPRQLARHRVDRRARVVACAVGARNVLEAAIIHRRAVPGTIAAVAAIDATHAASMIMVAFARPGRRPLATASAATAGALAGAALAALRPPTRREPAHHW
jgi:hypothetical protein